VKTTPTRALLSALLATIAAAPPAHAAFQVRRVSNADAIGSTAPVATLVSSPFDDSAARLTDGSDYFYAVFDSAGQSLPIATQRNTVAGCLRLSFDDGNPASAPVSAASSAVSLAPSSVRADGLQTAIALIVPRDASGVSLGRGLVLGVDASLLWPGRLAGAIEDLGDGTYRARVVSNIPGAGLLEVTVEGIALAAAPTVTFTPLDPNGSLRDLAILQLMDINAAGSRFAALAAAAGTGTDQAAAVQKAWADASDVLDSLANGDLSRDDNLLKSGLDGVLLQLAPLLDAPGALDPADVRDLMNDLLDVARLIAAYHLDLAEGVCGVCSDGHPRKVCDAAEALATADAARSALSPDWSSIVDAYARSVTRSIQAEHGC
jgi:hypothetical protein